MSTMFTRSPGLTQSVLPIITLSVSIRQVQVCPTRIALNTRRMRSVP